MQERKQKALNGENIGLFTLKSNSLFFWVVNKISIFSKYFSMHTFAILLQNQMLKVEIETKSKISVEEWRNKTRKRRWPQTFLCQKVLTVDEKWNFVPLKKLQSPTLSISQNCLRKRKIVVVHLHNKYFIICQKKGRLLGLLSCTPCIHIRESIVTCKSPVAKKWL